MATVIEPNQPETNSARPVKPIHRLGISANLLVQVILILFMLAAVNGLAIRHFKRWDLSREQKYALSDKTLRFVGTLKNKLRITQLFSSNVPIIVDVDNLLTEYQYAGKGKIDIERIDPERNYSRAKEALEKYKVVSGESLVVLDYEGRSKIVKASEMAEIDNSGEMLGEGPHISAFKGEQAITSAMMDLVEGKKNVVGYVTGHKEPQITVETPPPMLAQQQQQPASPVSVLKMFIENENIKFQDLNLYNEAQIPDDIKTIMIAGPQYDLSDREMKLLRDFWDKQGRIFLLLDPAAKIPKLAAFLNELGVKVNDDRLMVFIKTGIQEIAVTRDVQARFLGGNPVTNRLADVRALFQGGASSLTLEPDRVRAANVRVQPIIEAEKGYFAEKDYNTQDQAKLQNDARNAPQTPINIAAMVEKGGSGDAHVQVNSARLVVVSNSSFIEDNELTQDQQGLDFASAAINWLLSREQLIGIAPKVPKTLTFTLSSDALRNLRWLILVMIPVIPAVIGAGVWWQRRT